MEGSELETPIATIKAKPTSSDEKAPDSSDNTSLKKNVGPKSKKKKKINKDSLDPPKPLNAYNWFVKENREKIRTENPTWNFTEITKRLAQDWRALTAEQKQQYTESAEIDKERYARELSAYKQSEAYRSLIKNQKNKDQTKKLKENSNNLVLEEFKQEKDDGGTGFDIPIFTEEFLDHNKLREAELRQLRKSNTDYEQQNSILEKLIENTKTAIMKLEEETVQQKCHNQALQQHLDQMRVILTNAFQDISLPDEEKPTVQTIDSYVIKLHALLLNQNMNSPLHVKVREVVQQLNFHG